MLQETMQAAMSATEMIEMFTIKIETDQAIEKVAEMVPAECEKNKFALLQTYNYHEIVASKGFPIDRKVYIYEVCQAKVAAKMLTTNPEFSIFMPCKIVLYESGGKTVISTMNMEIVLKAVDEDKELYTETTSLFNSLKLMLESLSRS